MLEYAPLVYKVLLQSPSEDDAVWQDGAGGKDYQYRCIGGIGDRAGWETV